MIIWIKDEKTGRATEYSADDIKEELHNLKKAAGLKPRGAVYLKIYTNSDKSPILKFVEFGTGRNTETVL